MNEHIHNSVAGAQAEDSGGVQFEQAFTQNKPPQTAVEALQRLKEMPSFRAENLRLFPGETEPERQDRIREYMRNAVGFEEASAELFSDPEFLKAVDKELQWLYSEPTK